MAGGARAPAWPEPMNASPFHSKVNVSLALSDQVFVAGQHVSGKIQIESRADAGLGIGVIMVELVAIQGTSVLPSIEYPPLTSPSRAHVPRSLRDVHLPTQSKTLPSPRPPTIQRRPAPPNPRRAPAASRLPPSKARPNNLLLPHPNPANVPLHDILRERPRARAL